MKPTQEQILRALNKLVRENKTELKAEKIELGLVDDILSDVNANGKSRSNYRKFIREARASLGKANEQLENLKKRDERIIKASKNSNNKLMN